ncbi:MAG: uridine kinase [Hyphomonas sp.]|uniref:uridine kinase n=1 Tax=Hyphomonas sp. TaxID=87 RepID=UPI0017E7F30F|nr:uridine kinase [Hyphomonas sp.]MBU3921080.1 uridine kinase [Alphaproteobacteria bacterium]MBA3070242.1 uridine kinase [Hyphomonas sp.]MBU4062727.1 uridine kinase [Alphaproteobacteria bacterium]MBU4163646.1 uridine kinase [Alphaproteobacteria bacterium]MBU4567918.1 uridine kinase [Alphaproteobacteria bacterium]
MTKRKSFLIAMSGGSGSGKSTLAVALLERLGPGKAVMFGEDAYYHPMAFYGAPQTEAEREALIARINYDDPKSKEVDHLVSDLRALKAGETIQQPIYDYERHDRSEKTRRIESAPVLILEGIHALSMPKIRSFIDLSVYVDTPDDLRLARRLRRDVLERGRTVDSVLLQYMSTVRAAHYRFTYPAMFEADLVIADEGVPAYGDVKPSSEAIERMIAPVLSRLQTAGVI